VRPVLILLLALFLSASVPRHDDSYCALSRQCME
jgi:hypothetical protein